MDFIALNLKIVKKRLYLIINKKNYRTKIIIRAITIKTKIIKKIKSIIMARKKKIRIFREKKNIIWNEEKKITRKIKKKNISQIGLY